MIRDLDDLLGDLVGEVRSLRERVSYLERQEKSNPNSVTGNLAVSGNTVLTGSLEVNGNTQLGSASGNFLRIGGVTNPRLYMREHSLGSGVTTQILTQQHPFGWLFVSCGSDAQGALFYCRGGGNSVVLLTQSLAGRYTVTPGNIGTHNVYYSVGNNRYELHNGIGSVRDYEILFVGR